MAGFDDPEEAFTPSGEKLRVGTTWLHLYNVGLQALSPENLLSSLQPSLVSLSCSSVASEQT
jgi:hypothetical protein